MSQLITAWPNSEIERMQLHGVVSTIHEMLGMVLQDAEGKPVVTFKTTDDADKICIEIDYSGDKPFSLNSFPRSSPLEAEANVASI